MQILIDADGCPVVRAVIDSCKKYPQLQVLLICDTSHQLQIEGVRTITVSKGADSADFALVNLIKPGDVVVTQDYGLAAMCLAKRARVVRQDGLEYTDNNIEALLQIRYENKKTRMAGGRIKGPKKRRAEDDTRFIKNFEALLREAVINCHL